MRYYSILFRRVFKAYSAIFTGYTDRAFPTSDSVDQALRYALRYEVAAFYNGVKGLEDAVVIKSPRQAQRSFAIISLAYDHYLKAGDLYSESKRSTLNRQQSGASGSYSSYGYEELSSKLSYIAPSIEAPGLQDDVVLVQGPDKGRKGTVLWIGKGQNMQPANVVVKLSADDIEKEVDSTDLSYREGIIAHKEVISYPYAFVAKTTPPEVQFFDDFLAAYVASAISSGVMYPVDTYKTRIQSGRKGIPISSEGGFLQLWSGVQFFILDANDAIYVASYGLIKPAMLVFVDVSNSFFVFLILILAGSIGDALGSAFRVYCEIIVKQIQAGTLTSSQGWRVLFQTIGGTFNKDPKTTRAIALAWIAVLCRDMPFAGLQIAFFDFYKGLFSYLDDMGLSTFLQRALWGACAGSTAAVLTTPFDLLTTNVML